MARAEAVEMPNCCVVLWPTEGSRRPGPVLLRGQKYPPTSVEFSLELLFSSQAALQFIQALLPTVKPKGVPETPITTYKDG